MSAVIKQLKPAVNVAEMARKALAECDGDWEKAARLLRSWADSNETLYRALADSLIDKACWSAIRGASHNQRRNLFDPTHGEIPLPNWNDADIRAVAKNGWYDYALPGGLKLGDAKREDVEEAIDFHMVQSRSNMVKAKWLQLLLGRLTDPAKIVRDLVKEEIIAELAGQAKIATV